MHGANVAPRCDVEGRSSGHDLHILTATLLLQLFRDNHSWWESQHRTDRGREVAAEGYTWGRNENYTTADFGESLPKSLPKSAATIHKVPHLAGKR